MDTSFFANQKVNGMIALVVVTIIDQVFLMKIGKVFGSHSTEMSGKFLKWANESPDRTYSAELIREARIYDRHGHWMRFAITVFSTLSWLLCMIAGAIVIAFG